MKGILIAVFLGIFGGFRFYKKQKVLGFIYLFSLGLGLLGWAFDIIQAVYEYLKSRSGERHDYARFIAKNPNGFKGKKVVDSDIAGSFAECKKDPSVKRFIVIESLRVGTPLSIETAYFEGKPYFLVCAPNGMDIGSFPRELSAFVKDNCPDAYLSAVLIDKEDTQHPKMTVTIER